MSCEDMHVGDYGALFKLTVRDQDDAIQDLSGASTLAIRFYKPNNTTLDVTPTLFTDGTDGILQYTFVDGDIDQAGTWQVQAIITYPASKFHSSITKIKVLRNL